jgi:hypothetical protein
MIVWTRWSRGFWRSPCGRFDLFRHSEGWTAIDWDLGRRYLHADKTEVKAWCERRVST